VNRRIVIGLVVCLLVVVWAAPVQAQSDGPPPQATVHIVQRGETLYSIGQRYGATVDAITHANGIPDPRQLYVGQRLVIPGATEDVAGQETAPYVVQAGDMLPSIARRYHTTWQILAQVNGMLSPNGIYAESSACRQTCLLDLEMRRLPACRWVEARFTPCVPTTPCSASPCVMAYRPGRWRLPAASRTRP